MKGAAILFIHLYGSTPRMEAQATTGELVGTVRDSSGAVVPGAAVQAREVQTGLTRSVASK